jgi:hypothetical protein
MSKKIDYRTYECSNSDSSELSDSDSDPDSIIANHIADYRLFYPSSEESGDDHPEQDDYDSDEYYLQSEHEESGEIERAYFQTYHVYLSEMFEVLHYSLLIDLVKACNEGDIENSKKIYSIFQHDNFTKMYNKIYKKIKNVF